MDELEINDGMTDEQYNAMLETLARLIEAKAATVSEAAQIVREAKVRE